MLYYLCEWQLEKPEQLKTVNETAEWYAAEWRVEPIGYDAKWNTYWLFDDNRLYKELADTKRKKRKKTLEGDDEGVGFDEVIDHNSHTEDGTCPGWILVCSTIVEWKEFPEKFAHSTSTAEVQFYDYLISKVLPPVLASLKQKEVDIEARRVDRETKKQEKLDAENEALIKALQGPEMREVVKPEPTRESRRLEREIRVQQQMEFARLKREREARGEFEEIVKATYLDDGEDDYASRKRKSRKIQKDLDDDEEEEDLDDEEEEEEEFEEEEEIEEEEDEKVLEDAKEIQEEPLKSPPRKKVEIVSEDSIDPLSDPIEVDGDPDSWIFDCSCGVKGKNYDDGTPSIVCEDCNRWKHISCMASDMGLKFYGKIADPKEWEKRDFECLNCIEKKRRKQPKMDLNKTIQESLRALSPPPMSPTRLNSPPPMSPTRLNSLPPLSPTRLNSPPPLSPTRPPTRLNSPPLISSVPLTSSRAKSTSPLQSPRIEFRKSSVSPTHKTPSSPKFESLVHAATASALLPNPPSHSLH